MKNKFVLKSVLILTCLLGINKVIANECLEKDKININIDKMNIPSINSKMGEDFKAGIKCYKPAKFHEPAYIKSEFIENDKSFLYENVINFGKQKYFINGKIPDNSFLLSHPYFLTTMYKDKYLNNEDINDYYLSLERVLNSDNTSNPTQIIYHSPFNGNKIMFHTQLEKNTKDQSILFYFMADTEDEILKMKEVFENHFLVFIQQYDLGLKLENKENLEIMRMYKSGTTDSLSILEPYIKEFLDFIDVDKKDFSENLKYEFIDKIFTERKELSPLTLFSNDVVITYTFDKVSKSGLIAFTFLKEESKIKEIQKIFSKTPVEDQQKAISEIEKLEESIKTLKNN